MTRPAWALLYKTVYDFGVSMTTVHVPACRNEPPLAQLEETQQQTTLAMTTQPYRQGRTANYICVDLVVVSGSRAQDAFAF